MKRPELSPAQKRRARHLFYLSCIPMLFTPFMDQQIVILAFALWGWRLNRLAHAYGEAA